MNTPFKGLARSVRPFARLMERGGAVEEIRRHFSRRGKSAPSRMRLANLQRLPNMVHRNYAKVSDKYPFATAGITCGVVFFWADVFAQAVFPPVSLVTDEKGQSVIKAQDHFNMRRCAALMAFGLIYYGGPLKFIYLGFDRWLGPKRAMLKASLDVLVHTPFLAIPAYFIITGTVKGQTPGEIQAQMREEWFDASTGSMIFWLPVCMINFRYIPQHSRVAVTAGASFVQKTWLSWLTNRRTYAAASAAATTNRSSNFTAATPATPGLAGA